MGENADDIVEGFVCSWCGLYFEEEHGFPVLCTDCARKQQSMIDRGKYPAADRIPTATHKELG